MKLSEWEDVLDRFLEANELPRLRAAGSVSATEAKQLADERYATFDKRRKEAEKLVTAEVGDFEELQRIAEPTKRMRSEGEDV